MTLPPIPAWDGLHPIITHFPIALLLVAPVFLVLAMLLRTHEKGLLISTAVTMILGLAGAFVAVSTGEAAGELAERMPGVDAALERHEELAELARNLFAGLTALLSVIVIWRLATRKPGRTPFIAVGILYLALHAGASLVLANAAHEGGRLVHEFGVRAVLTPASASARGTVAPSPESARPSKAAEDDDD